MNFSSGKRLMTSLMKQKDLENKSILACLQARKISLDQFVINLGLESNFLNGAFYDEIMHDMEKILSENETNIYFNPSVESVSDEEISFYNAKTKNHFAFSNDSVRVGTGISFLENNVIQKNIFWKEIRLKNGFFSKIDFDIHYNFDYIGSIFPRKFINNFILNVTFAYTENDQVKEIKYEISIPVGYDKHSLSDLLDELYHFDALGIYKEFLKSNLPGIKITDNFYFKNMNKDVSR